MPQLALYRKYRSEDFSTLAGQTAVVSSLEKAVTSGRVSHAYLFSGPRGVGKTSAARILARRINNLTLQQANNHLDIIEIDAASNRRIDEIRDLREKVHVAPVSAKYKVYIIDEVHMLTTEAFNALLKTLEEPPEHVVFVLATTDIYSLPETIVSRTQHFRFQPIPPNDATKHLAGIAKKEKINIEPEALELIARAGSGSLRDCLSILDQLSHSSGKINSSMVRELLGWTDDATLSKLALDVARYQPKAVLTALDKLLASGISADQLLRQLMEIYLQAIREKMGIGGISKQQGTLESLSSKRLQQIVKRLSTLNPNSNYFAPSFEAAMLELSLQEATSDGTEENTTTNIAPRAEKRHKADKPIEPKHQKSQAEPTEQAAQRKPQSSVLGDGWIKVLMEVKKHNNSLYALLRSAEADVDQSQITVTFRFQFHQRRLEEASNRQVLAKAAKKVFGEDMEIIIETHKNTRPSANNEEDKEAVNSVLQILGGEVVNG